MMVVLLIMSIIMAAMAPVMTTRMSASKTAENASPWKYVRDSGKSQAYFGIGGTHKAMIGQREILADSTENARLIINAPQDNDMSHILFKRTNDILGFLSFGGQYIVGDPDTRYILLGNLTASSSSLGGDGGATLIGNGITYTADASGSADVTALGNSAVVAPGSTAIGTKASAGTGSIAIGSNASATPTISDIPAIAIGNSAKANGGISIGHNTMNEDSTGANNIAIGHEALSSNTAGYGNIAVGTNVLNANTSGYDNTAVGYYALKKNTTGHGNTAVGEAALLSNTTYHGNTAIGSNALKDATASGNTAVGASALQFNTNGEYNTAIGGSAMYMNNGGYRNTAVGWQSMNANTNGYRNTAVGWHALFNNKTSADNTAIGNEALADNTASSNTAVGSYSLYFNKTGEKNVAVGGSALIRNINGKSNTAIGIGACSYVKGSNKTCIGANSGPPEDSDYAKESNTDEIIYLGSKPKIIHDAFKDWGHNSAVVQIENISGDGKTLGEEQSGRRKGYTDGPNVLINGNLFVKGYLGALIADDRGDEYDEWGILSSNKPHGDDRTVKWGYVTWPSDRRLKYVGKESISGLDKIRQLKVFNYTFKKDEKKTPHVGVIAQDLQKVFPDAVTKGDDGFLRIRMEDMFYAVINAIKELDAKVTEILKRVQDDGMEIQLLRKQVQNDRSEITQLIKQVNEKDKRIKKLEAQNNALEKRLEALEAKIK